MSLFRASQLTVTMNHITNFFGIARVSLNHRRLVYSDSPRSRKKVW